MKQTLIESIREVPISGKTYEEYVEAVADKLIAEDYRKASDIEKEIEDLKAIAKQYRKQFEEARTDVAREIFEEIETLLHQNATMQIATTTLHCKLAELKKKYTEDGK